MLHSVLTMNKPYKNRSSSSFSLSRIILRGFNLENTTFSLSLKIKQCSLWSLVLSFDAEGIQNIAKFKHVIQREKLRRGVLNAD